MKGSNDIKILVLVENNTIVIFKKCSLHSPVQTKEYKINIKNKYNFYFYI